MQGARSEKDDAIAEKKYAENEMEELIKENAVRLFW